jgi:DNA polymerase-3 subunit alpha
VIAPEWSEQERLGGEKETLGLYLSGHPIQRHLPEINHFITHRIQELRPSAATAVIPGIVTSIRSIQTKRGDRMAIISIDDGSGRVDVLCFSDNYHKYHDVLVKDKLLIVTGEVSIDEFNGGHRVVAREFATLEQARERYAKCVKINFAEAKEEMIHSLADLLKPHRGGNCHVAIDYQRSDATAELRLGDEWRVRPTDALLQLLHDMFSEQNVVVVY